MDHSLALTNPILPPFQFQHLGVTYHVFVDLKPERFPHGAEFDVFLPGALTSVSHVSIPKGDMVLFVRGEQSDTIRAGCREARRQFAEAKKHRADLTLVPDAAVADFYTTPDGVRYHVLLDVDQQKFPAGLTVSVCAVGEVEALPAIGVAAGDLLIRVDGDVADNLRHLMVESYNATMKQMKANAEARGVRG